MEELRINGFRGLRSRASGIRTLKDILIFTSTKKEESPRVQAPRGPPPIHAHRPRTFAGRGSYTDARNGEFVGRKFFCLSSGVEACLEGLSHDISQLSWGLRFRVVHNLGERGLLPKPASGGAFARTTPLGQLRVVSFAFWPRASRKSNDSGVLGQFARVSS